MKIRDGLEIPDGALRALCTAHHVQALALFGSSARGEAKADSDVDLLVEFESGAVIGFIALARLQEELEKLLGVKVDVVSRLGLNRHIRDAVLAEARTLYAA